MVPQVRVNERRILDLMQVDLALIPSEKKSDPQRPSERRSRNQDKKIKGVLERLGKSVLSVQKFVQIRVTGV